MKRSFANRGLELAIAAFCAWQASDLLTAWRHSPFDRLGWLSFAIWMAPSVVIPVSPSELKPDSTLSSVLALATLLVGRVLDLNALLCVALALSLSAFVPTSPRKMFWLAGAVAWMPVLGWLAHDLPTIAVSSIRLVTAAAAGAILLLRRAPLRFA